MSLKLTLTVICNKKGRFHLTKEIDIITSCTKHFLNKIKYLFFREYIISYI